jgi:hypothetical protein
MSNFWWQNPTILYKDTNIFPKKNMNTSEKSNASARLAILYGVLLVVLQRDLKWMAVSFLLLVISFFVGAVDTFEKNSDIKCVHPTKDNPYMNYNVFDDINRKSACDVEQVREDQIKLYQDGLYPDKTDFDPLYNDLYGKNINDVYFYTMPSTTAVNDQTQFAKWVYGDFGKCKSEGKDCLKHRDNRFARGRYSYQY